MNKIRPATKNKYGIDFPILPATRLIDDINHVVVDLEHKKLGPEHYAYIITKYPESHHIG